MPDTNPAVQGIVTALEPILAKRPVTVNFAPAPGGKLVMSILPVRVDDKEDASIGRGVTFPAATAAELDEMIATGALAESFVQSHVSLQAALENIAAANNAAATTALKNQRDKKGKAATTTTTPAKTGTKASTTPAPTRIAANPVAAPAAAETATDDDEPQQSDEAETGAEEDEEEMVGSFFD